MAVTFDGATYLEIPSLSCTDGTSFSFSVWTRNPSQLSTGWVFECDPASTRRNGCTVDGNGFDLFVDDSTNTNGAEYSVWSKLDSYYHHYLFSTDTASNVAVLKIDGVSALTLNTNPWGSFPFTSNFNGLPIYIGSNLSQFFLGDMDYLWIAPNVSLISGGDIPEATILKFRSQIGIQGVPTDPSNYPSPGSVLLYGNASAFATNHGAGGAASVTGTLTDAAITPSNQTFISIRKTYIITGDPTIRISPSGKIAIPADWTSEGSVIHAIGSGQSGANSNSSVGGSGGDLGGNGGDYAYINAPGFSPGDVLDAQVQNGFTAANHAAGADTWLKNLLGATVLLARGGGSATSVNVGDGSYAGGRALAPTEGNYDGAGTLPSYIASPPLPVRAPLYPGNITYGNGSAGPFAAFNTAGGGGGGGAAGPAGNGGDSGDQRPWFFYTNVDSAHPPTSAAWIGLAGAAGGGANGGQPGGGAAATAAGLVHLDGTPLVPSEGGDCAAANGQGGISARYTGADAIAAGTSAGAAGAPTNYASGAGNDGGNGALWTDTEQNPALPSFYAGPGGGAGGMIATAPIPSGEDYGGGVGGTYGGGGAGGGATSPYGYGAPGVLVLQYWTPGSRSVIARTRIWGNPP